MSKVKVSNAPAWGSAAVAVPGLPVEDFTRSSPEAWDTLYLDNRRVPGLSTVTGKVALRKDTRAIPGKTGARLTTLGYEPAKLHVTVKLWTEEQFQEFQRLMQRLRPIRGRHPEAMTIRHPAANLLGVAKVVVMEVGAPSIKGGIAEVELQVEEFLPPVRGQGPKVPKGGPAAPSILDLAPDGGAIAARTTPQAKPPSEAFSGPDTQASFATLASFNDRDYSGEFSQ